MEADDTSFGPTYEDIKEDINILATLEQFSPRVRFVLYLLALLSGLNTVGCDVKGMKKGESIPWRTLLCTGLPFVAVGGLSFWQHKARKKMQKIASQYPTRTEWAFNNLRDDPDIEQTVKELHHRYVNHMKQRGRD